MQTATPLVIAPPAVLNTAVLNNLHTLLGDELREVLITFLNDAPRVIAALRQVIVANDLCALQWLAYRLQGSSAAVGAQILEAACADLTRITTPREALAQVEQIAEQYDRVDRALRQQWFQSAPEQRVRRPMVSP